MCTIFRPPAAFYEHLIKVVIAPYLTTAAQKNLLYYPLTSISPLHAIAAKLAGDGITPYTISANSTRKPTFICNLSSIFILMFIFFILNIYCHVF